MKSKKYFNRIFCVFTVLCTIVSLLFSLLFYISSIKNANSDFLNSKQTETAAAAMKAERIIELCEKSAKIFAQTYPSAPIDVGVADMEKVCSDGDLYVADENSFLYKRDNSPALERTVFEKLASGSAEKRIFTYTWNGGEYIAFANCVQTQNGKIYIMRTFEENDFLRKINSSAEAIVVFYDATVMYVGNERHCADLKSHINEIGTYNAFLQAESGESKGKNCIYTTARSEYFSSIGEIFVYSSVQLGSDYGVAALVSVAVFFITLIIMTLLCYFAAKIAYHPIDELNAYTARYSHVADTTDEVKHISETLKNMQNNAELLKTEMEKDKNLLREHFVKDLLIGIVDENAYGEMCETYLQDEYETPFYAGVFEISDYSALAEAFGEQNLFQIKKQIVSFINGELKGRSVQEAFEIDRKRFAVVTCGCELAKIRQNFSYIVSVVNSEFDVEMLAVIGSACDKLFNINESYQTCVKTLDDSAVFGFRSSVIVCDDIKTASAGFYYPVNLERDLISSVMRQKREETMRIINNILDENLNGKTLTKEKHNAIIFAFTATVNRIVEALNKTTDEIYGEDNIIFLELKMCEDAGALRAKIIQSFDKIITYMSGSEDADMSERLVDYIHSHYNEDISLTEIGEHFNKSKCYISTVFKETTGENFKDYLSRYRIKKAKEILTKNPNIKTKELASMIGCNTVATLFRLFNKYENMSPGQFVKNNENK